MTLSPIRVDQAALQERAGKQDMLKHKKMQKKEDAEKSVDISEKLKRQVQLKVFILSPKRGNSSGQERKWR